MLTPKTTKDSQELYCSAENFQKPFCARSQYHWHFPRFKKRASFLILIVPRLPTYNPNVTLEVISPGHGHPEKVKWDKSICYIFYIIPKAVCLPQTVMIKKRDVENELAIILRVIQETCVAVVHEGYLSWWSCTQNIDSYKRYCISCLHACTVSGL